MVRARKRGSNLLKRCKDEHHHLLMIRMTMITSSDFKIKKRFVIHIIIGI